MERTRERAQILAMRRLLLCAAAVAALLAGACGSAASLRSCVIDLYAPFQGVLAQEVRCAFSMLLHMRTRCTCKVRLRDRAGVVDAIRSLRTYEQPSMVLFAVYGVQPDEAEAIKQQSEHARSKLVVLHFSDEHGNHDLSWYGDVKAVFRNYHRQIDALKEQARYITGGAHAAGNASGGGSQGGGSEGGGSEGGSAGNVFWFPLGYGEWFIPSSLLYMETSMRPWVWSWAGSVSGKSEREQVVTALDDKQMKKLGKLHMFDNFAGDNKLMPLTYTAYLYNSMTVPLPPGMNPEQFRLWEALIAGTIPIVAEHHLYGGLAHVPLLGIRTLVLDSWWKLRDLINQVHTNQTLQLEMQRMQAHNSRVYANVMRAVSTHMADRICAFR